MVAAEVVAVVVVAADWADWRSMAAAVMAMVAVGMRCKSRMGLGRERRSTSDRGRVMASTCLLYLCLYR